MPQIMAGSMKVKHVVEEKSSCHRSRCFAILFPGNQGLIRYMVAKKNQNSERLQRKTPWNGQNTWQENWKVKYVIEFKSWFQGPGTCDYKVKIWLTETLKWRWGTIQIMNNNRTP